MSVLGRTLGGMAFDWSSIEVREVGEMPRRSARPVEPRIIEAVCANCGECYGPPHCRRSQYCTTRCHDQADVVRYGRKQLRMYGDHPPVEIQRALRTQMAFALRDGYDESARHIPQHRRDDVLARADHQCECCGAPGTEIDHNDGPSGDLDNLQLLCGPCHRRKTRRRFVPITSPVVEAERQALLRRINADEPERACDADNWEDRWRDWWHEHATFSD